MQLNLISKLNNPTVYQKPRRPKLVYTITGTTFQVMRAGTNIRWGTDFTVTSKLVGKTIVGARFVLRKVGAPTGIVSCKIFDSALNLVGSMGQLNAALVDPNEGWYDFWGFPYTIPAANFARIAVEYTGGDASNHIDAKTVGADAFDGANTQLTWFDGAIWNNSGGEDCAGSIWIL